MPDMPFPFNSFWLVEEKILLKPVNQGIMAFVLEPSGANGRTEGSERLIRSYVQLTAILASYVPYIDGSSGNTLSSDAELGENANILRIGNVSTGYPNEAIEAYAPIYKSFVDGTKNLFVRYGRLIDDFPFLGNALSYWYRSKVNPIDPRQGFVDSTIALECLYNDGSTDVKYKISARSSFLMSFTGLEPVQTFMEMKKLYDTRSGIVHGGEVLPTSEETRKGVDFARRSIMCFLVLCSTRPAHSSKGELLREIDEALLDSSKKNSIRAEMERLTDFDLGLPRTLQGEGWKISW